MELLAKIGKYVSTLEIDASKASQTLKDFRASLKDVNAAIKDVDNTEKAYGKTAESSATKIELVAKKQQLLKERFEEVSRVRAELEDRQTKGIQLTEEEARELQKLQREHNTLATSITKANTEFTRAKKSAVDFANVSFDKIKGELDALGKNVDKIKSGFSDLKGVATEIGMVGGLLGGASLNEFKNYSTGLADVKRLANPNASEEELKGLEEMFRRVSYRSNRAEDVDVISDVFSNIVGKVDSSTYLDGSLESAINTILDGALAYNMSTAELTQMVNKYLPTLKADINDIDNILSGFNGLQNTYSVDIGKASETFGRSLAGGLGAGFDASSVMGYAGFTANLGSMEESGAGTAWNQLFKMMASAAKDQSAEIAKVLDRFRESTGQTLTMEQLQYIKQNDADSYRKFIKAVNLPSQQIEALLENYGFQKDIMRYNNLGSTDELLQKYKQAPEELLEGLFRGIKQESESTGELVANIIASKSYLPSSSLVGQVVSLGAENHSVLKDYRNVAKNEYDRGLAVAEEAEVAKNTFESKLKQTMNQFKDNLVSIGEELSPYMLEILESLLPKAQELTEAIVDILKTGDPKEWGKKIADWLELFVKIKAMSLGARTVGGSVKVITGVFGSLNSALKMAKGIKDWGNSGGSILTLIKSLKEGKLALDGAVAGTGMAGSAAGSLTASGGLLTKFSGVLAGLASPLGLAIGGITGLATAIALAESASRKAREEAAYRKLSDEEAGKVKDAVGDSKKSVAKLNAGIVSDRDVEGIRERLVNQQNQVVEELNTIRGLGASNDQQVNKNREIQVKTLETNLQKIGLALDDFDSLVAEFGVEGSNQLATQTERIQELVKTVDVAYADSIGKNAQDVYSATQSQSYYKNLDIDTKNEIVKELRDELTELEERFSKGLITEYDYLKRETEILLQNKAMRDSATFIERHFQYDNSLKDVEGIYNNDQLSRIAGQQELISNLTNFTTQGLNLSESDLQLVNSIKNELIGMQNEYVMLDEIAQNHSMGALLELINQYGIEVLGLFQTLGTGDAIDPVIFREMGAYVELLGADAELTTQQMQMMAASFLATQMQGMEMMQILTENELWDDPEALKAVMRVDLDNQGLQGATDAVFEAIGKVPPEIDVDTLRARTNVDLLDERLKTINRTLNTVEATAIRTSGALSNLVSNSTTNKPKKYATGTLGHSGGLAWVGDGGRREVIEIPGMLPFLSNNYPTLMSLPVGTQVFSSIDRYLSRLGGLPKYATGTIGATTNNTYGGLTLNLDVMGLDSKALTDEIRLETERIIKKHQARQLRNKRSAGR